MRINSTHRLKADPTPQLPKYTEDMSKTTQALQSAMAACFGKGLKMDQSIEGAHTSISFFAPSSTHDIGVNDLRRLQTAMLESKALLSIHVEGGKPVFTFEIEN
jgi:hypothetical protein